MGARPKEFGWQASISRGLISSFTTSGQVLTTAAKRIELTALLEHGKLALAPLLYYNTRLILLQVGFSPIIL